MKYQTEHILIAAKSYGQGELFALKIIVNAILESMSDEQLEVILAYVKDEREV